MFRKDFVLTGRQTKPSYISISRQVQADGIMLIAQSSVAINRFWLSRVFKGREMFSQLHPGVSALILTSSTVSLSTVQIMNDELLQRLAGKTNSVRPLVVPRSADSATPLNYHSTSADVETWLTSKGFSSEWVEEKLSKNKCLFPRQTTQ